MPCYVISREEETKDGLVAEVRRSRWAAMGAAGWAQMRGIEDTADDVVVAVAPVKIPNHRWLSEAVGFRARFPRIGLVLVLDPRCLTARWTRALSRVDALVPPNADRTALSRALDAAMVTGPLRELDATAAGLPKGTMRSALRTLLLAPGPPGTVDALARSVLSRGNTFSCNWPRARVELELPDGLGLKELIGLTALTRAVADRRWGAGSWEEVAGRSSLRRETLRRWSWRFLSCHLEGTDFLESR
jgi:hypothetical protein